MISFALAFRGIRDEVKMVVSPVVVTGVCSSWNMLVVGLHVCRSCRDVWYPGWDPFRSCVGSTDLLGGGWGVLECCVDVGFYNQNLILFGSDGEFGHIWGLFLRIKTSEDCFKVWAFCVLCRYLEAFVWTLKWEPDVVMSNKQLVEGWLISVPYVKKRTLFNHWCSLMSLFIWLIFFLLIKW